MIDTMAHGGKIAMLGIQSGQPGIDWDAVVFKGLNIRGIYGRMFGETWYKLTPMIRSGMDIGRVITHRYLLQGFPAGLRRDAFRQFRQGHSRLERTVSAALDESLGADLDAMQKAGHAQDLPPHHRARWIRK